MSGEIAVKDDEAVIDNDGSSFAVSSIDSNRTNYFNRELSWLSFNARVLSLAADPAVPLLERVKYLAIYAGNLDEFFQVRVAGLRDLVAAEVRVVGPDGRTPDEQLDSIRDAVQKLEAHRQVIFNQLLPQLHAHGVSILQYRQLSVLEIELLLVFGDVFLTF